MPMTPPAILALGSRFQETRIFLTAAEPDVFTLLANNPMSAREMAEGLQVTLGGITVLLDAAPGMTATIFDLPPVIDIARRRLAAAGLLGRVVLVAGDFCRDELPAGHDPAIRTPVMACVALNKASFALQELFRYGKECARNFAPILAFDAACVAVFTAYLAGWA
jgi:hypothetical protein